MQHPPNSTRSTAVRLGYWAMLAYAWSAVSVELLSVFGPGFGAISRPSLIAVWVLFVLGLAVHVRRNPIHISDQSFWKSRATWTGESGLLLVLVCLALVSTLITALVAAPNNWDSMVYHLSRVAQWASRGSIAFYETGISRQVSQPPAGEYAILHTYVLTGGDRLANMVQWMAGLLALIGIRELASGFWPGDWDDALRRRAGAWTLLAVVGLPMFLLQQSSTQNDLVLGAVIVWSAVAALRHVQYRRRGDAVMAMLGLAMAWWTKGTALLLVPPILVLWKLAYYPQSLRHRKSESGAISPLQKAKALLPSVRIGFLAVLVIALFNAPHALRNKLEFDRWLGPDYMLANGEHGLKDQLGAGLGNTARNAAWLLRTPNKTANQFLHDATGAFHGALGRDLHDPEATWPWTPPFDPVAFGDREHIMQEDYAPAPVFFALLLFSSLAIWINRSKTWSKPMQGYTLAWWLLFFGFGLVLRWQVWHMRLLLPFLLLAAVPLGAWLARLPRIPRAALAIFLLIGSAPYWWSNYSRPWFGEQSIFTTPRISQYFFTWPELEAPYRERAALMSHSELLPTYSLPASILSADAWDYPLWVLANPKSFPSVPAYKNGDGTWTWEQMSRPLLDPLLVWPSEWADRDSIVSPDALYRRIAPPGEGVPAVFRAERLLREFD